MPVFLTQMSAPLQSNHPQHTVFFYNYLLHLSVQYILFWKGEFCVSKYVFIPTGNNVLAFCVHCLSSKYYTFCLMKVVPKSVSVVLLQRHQGNDEWTLILMFVFALIFYIYIIFLIFFDSCFKGISVMSCPWSWFYFVLFLKIFFNTFKYTSK